LSKTEDNGATIPSYMTPDSKSILVDEIIEFRNVEGEQEWHYDLLVEFDGVDVKSPFDKILEYIMKCEIGPNG